jgi:hypothetical protein
MRTSAPEGVARWERFTATFKDRGTHSVKGFEGAVHLVAAEL